MSTYYALLIAIPWTYVCTRNLPQEHHGKQRQLYHGLVGKGTGGQGQVDDINPGEGSWEVPVRKVEVELGKEDHKTVSRNLYLSEPPVPVYVNNYGKADHSTDTGRKDYQVGRIVTTFT